MAETKKTGKGLDLSHSCSPSLIVFPCAALQGLPCQIKQPGDVSEAMVLDEPKTVKGIFEVLAMYLPAPMFLCIPFLYPFYIFDTFFVSDGGYFGLRLAID